MLLEAKRLETKFEPYNNKKNYATNAISPVSERYKGGRSRWDKKQPPRQPEDLTAFRQVLSPRIPLEDKEHLLLSYLLLDTEGYRFAMDTLNTLQPESPVAVAFLDSVKTLEGQWDTTEMLIEKLNAAFHESENMEQLQFLAQRLLVVDELQESYQSPGKGLKYTDAREKLNRDIQDIANRIRELRRQVALSILAKDAKQYEQREDDQLALDAQRQLREALAQRRQQAQGNSISSIQDQAVHNGNPVLAETQQQGV